MVSSVYGGRNALCGVADIAVDADHTLFACFAGFECSALGIFHQTVHDKYPSRRRRDPWARQGLDQGVASAHTRVAAARSAGDGGRIALVYGPDDQCAWPARPEDRPFQGVSSQDASLRTARSG